MVMNRIKAVQADITTLDVGAIVNAANQSLLGGGGVDGAIHRAAGPELLEACRAVPEMRPGVRCPTGEARITAGFQLPARYIIHTVGPVWSGGRSGEQDLLAGCYNGALALAVQHEIRSIAFPAISCGAFGYPISEAVSVAVSEISRFLADDDRLERVLLVAFEEAVLRALSDALIEHSQA
jgi:O-acetyl-ADP-ribose deacetylase (regulator of RNase III)